MRASRIINLYTKEIKEVSAKTPDEEWALQYEYYDKLNQFPHMKDVLEINRVYRVPKYTIEYALYKSGKLSRGTSTWIIIDGELRYVRTAGFKLLNLRESRDEKIKNIINED